MEQSARLCSSIHSKRGAMKRSALFIHSCAVAAFVACTLVFGVATAAASPVVALEGSLSSKPVLAFNADTKMLIITIDHAQQLSISAYVMTGKKVTNLACEKYLAAGTHRISFNNQKLSNGVVVFRVEGAGFSVSKTIDLTR